MSVEAREQLVNSGHLFFQDDSQKSDLLDPDLTQTGLIALLSDLVFRFGHHLEITAVRKDHHDDHALGVHCHFDGYAVDLWPLNSATAGDYMDAGSDAFKAFLEHGAESDWLYQVGLAGSADTPRNRYFAGRTAFEDDGGDHVHFGASN